jgi:hypothetical protein
MLNADQGEQSGWGQGKRRKGKTVRKATSSVINCSFLSGERVFGEFG